MTGRDEKGKDEYDENGQKPETAKKIATGRDESGKRSTTKTKKRAKTVSSPFTRGATVEAQRHS